MIAHQQQSYFSCKPDSPEFSKIVDFKLTILLTFSSYQIKPETLKTILSQNLIIEEISNLIKLKQITIFD